MKKKPEFKIDFYQGIVYRRTSTGKRAAVRCDYVCWQDAQAELVLDSTRYPEIFENLKHNFGLADLITLLKKEQLVSLSRALKQFNATTKYLHRRGFELHITSTWRRY